MYTYAKCIPSNRLRCVVFSKIHLMGLVLQKALVLLRRGSYLSLSAAVCIPMPEDAACLVPGKQRAEFPRSLGTLWSLRCGGVAEGHPAVWLSGGFSCMELYCRAWCCSWSCMAMLSCCSVTGLPSPWAVLSLVSIWASHQNRDLQP